VTLLGSDLIMASRIRSALSPHRLQLLQVSRGDQVGPSRLVFVDLNADVEARISAIARMRHREDLASIVAFCDHDQDGVMKRAMAAGASQVVANRHVATAAARLAAG